MRTGKDEGQVRLEQGGAEVYSGVSSNRKQAVEMGELTSPDPPNPIAISSRIKCSISLYQEE